MKCPYCNKETPEGKHCVACQGDIAWARDNGFGASVFNPAIQNPNIPSNCAPADASVEDWLAGVNIPEWIKAKILKDSSCIPTG